MKLIHTADWHLGNTFHGYDRTQEHRHFLDWLLDRLREQQPDALIVSGDIYDTPNPSAAAEELLYDFLLQATDAVRGLQVVLIAGNHDSAGRIDAPASLLKRHNIYVRGTLPLREDGQTPDYEHLVLPLSRRDSEEAELVCLAVPFLRPSDYPAGMTVAEGLRHVFENLRGTVSHSDFRGLPLIAAAHFYASGAEIAEGMEHSERLVVGGQDCVPPEVVGNGIAYTALGHLHKAQTLAASAGTMQYAGSPLPMSFSERHYIHGVTLVDITVNGHCETQRLPYHPLRTLSALPSKGAARPEEILDLVGSLPVREKGDDGTDWPYLEIRVREERPEPSLLHQVAQALEDKAVHFCRMIRELPQAAASTGKATAATHEVQPHMLAPLDMARLIFQDIYHKEMPAEMVERFNEACAEATD